ncbi:hypothetical protein SANTM175S_04928 [Streptomyces antimycoticus]
MPGRVKTRLTPPYTPAEAASLAETFRSDTFHTAPGTPAGRRVLVLDGRPGPWVPFAAAAWTVRRLGARQAAVFVLVGSAAVAATGLLGPPRTSTDAYRYAWDGRVQAAGISPYDHAPEDPALAPLRDRWLFPKGSACHGPDRAPVRPAAEPPAPGAHPRTDPAPDHTPDTPSNTRKTSGHTRGTSGPAESQCTRLNRPAVHTIYPPVAEGYFLLVHRSAPSGSTLLPLQTGGALLSVATTAVLLAAARRRPIPASRPPARRCGPGARPCRWRP